VIKTEEKGSDVNLATHLLIDGFDDAYELAVVRFERFGFARAHKGRNTAIG
jgi:hypothetical protein